MRNWQKKCEGVDWIQVAQGTNQWRALVNTIISIRVSWAGNFMSEYQLVCPCGWCLSASKCKLNAVLSSSAVDEKYKSVWPYLELPRKEVERRENKDEFANGMRSDKVVRLGSINILLHSDVRLLHLHVKLFYLSDSSNASDSLSCIVCNSKTWELRN
jgi:hypothetical protein